MPGLMPWDMHRLTVGEWQSITEAAERNSGGEGAMGEIPEGFDQLPLEEV